MKLSIRNATRIENKESTLSKEETKEAEVTRKVRVIESEILFKENRGDEAAKLKQGEHTHSSKMTRPEEMETNKKKKVLKRKKNHPKQRNLILSK